MGLKITTEIATDKGMTSEAYLMITEFFKTKKLNSQYPVKMYLSKAARDKDENDTCQSFVIPKMFTPTLKSIDATNADIYALIKAELEAKGLTVENQ